MKYLFPIFFFLFFSCDSLPLKARTGYLITEFDSDGKVEHVYNVDKFNAVGRKVQFDFEGKPTTVTGSFKIDKIK